MKKTSLSILLIVTLGLAMLSACGGGSSTSTQPSPTTAVLTLLTSGPSTTIYGIEVTVVLPAGVTAKSTISPPQTDTGVVTATGKAAGSLNITGVYTAATSTVKGTVHIVLPTTLGFGTGEYSAVNLNLVSGNTPTAGGFSLTNFKPVDDKGVDIIGLTPGFTVSIK